MFTIQIGHENYLNCRSDVNHFLGILKFLYNKLSAKIAVSLTERPSQELTYLCLTAVSKKQF